MADSERLQSLSIDELLREVRAREEAQSKAPTATEAPALTPDPSLQDVELATIVEKLQSEQKVIYGVDDRKDVFQIRNEKIRNDADSVVIWHGVQPVRHGAFPRPADDRLLLGFSCSPRYHCDGWPLCECEQRGDREVHFRLPHAGRNDCTNRHRQRGNLSRREHHRATAG